MERIIVILGPKTESIKNVLMEYHNSAVTVLGAYNSIEDFHKEYYKRTLRVDRIIVAEGAFSHSPYDELTYMKEVLDTFYADYKEVFFLVSQGSSSLELLTMLQSDLGERGELIRVFDNMAYNARMVIGYCLGEVGRKHFVKGETQYEEVVRERIAGESTFKIEEESDENEDTDIVIVESTKSSSSEFTDKKNNLLSAAQSHRDLTWEVSPIIKDINKLSDLSSVANKAKRYEIDYSSFYLSDKVNSLSENVMVVTGEKKSGKSTMSLAIAKSFTATGKKVLIVETDLKSLGLSDLIERSGLPVTAMLMQDFMNFKDAVRTMVNSNKKLNAIVANSSTAIELSKVNHFALINMLVICCKKYFDLVIVDIDIDGTEQCRPLLHYSAKVVVTTSNNVSGAVGVYKAINESDSLPTVNEKFLFIPCRLFNSIDGVVPDTAGDVTTTIKGLFGMESKLLPAVKITGFDINDSLYRAITAK